MANKTENGNGIMIFKDTFEYYKDGLLTAQQFTDLMMYIYDYRFNGIKPNTDEMDKSVLLIWKTLKHSVAKSKENFERRQRKLQAQETAQNEEIIEKECNDAKLQPNTSFYPTDDNDAAYQRFLDM